MHEIRATVPPEHAKEAARLAHNVGIEKVSIADIYIDGPDVRRQVVSVETSTPKARAFRSLSRRRSCAIRAMPGRGRSTD